MLLGRSWGRVVMSFLMSGWILQMPASDWLGIKNIKPDWAPYQMVNQSVMSENLARVLLVSRLHALTHVCSSKKLFRERWEVTWFPKDYWSTNTLKRRGRWGEWDILWDCENNRQIHQRNWIPWQILLLQPRGGTTDNLSLTAQYFSWDVCCCVKESYLPSCRGCPMQFLHLPVLRRISFSFP